VRNTRPIPQRCNYCGGPTWDNLSEAGDRLLAGKRPPVLFRCKDPKCEGSKPPPSLSGNVIDLFGGPDRPGPTRKERAQ